MNDVEEFLKLFDEFEKDRQRANQSLDKVRQFIDKKLGKEVRKFNFVLSGQLVEYSEEDQTGTVVNPTIKGVNIKFLAS